MGGHQLEVVHGLPTQVGRHHAEEVTWDDDVNDDDDDDDGNDDDEGVGLTDDGEQDGEEEGGQADPLARPAAGVDVVLQWEHDGHQPGDNAQEIS